MYKASNIEISIHGITRVFKFQLFLDDYCIRYNRLYIKHQFFFIDKNN
ncbi:hypothetical protein c7_L175 [Megavirus courdo7]|uniref:Uncharacterized protein n=1 Tax=Megavirus courdo7 TaxID=1128135 RepID=H2EA18_9VIRU|nr:hypothetical protein c7_L175 [Megavirus courdo7]